MLKHLKLLLIAVSTSTNKTTNYRHRNNIKVISGCIHVKIMAYYL